MPWRSASPWSRPAGTTRFDTNIAALKALLAKWQRTDETYAEGGPPDRRHEWAVRPGGRYGPQRTTDQFFAHVFGKRQDRIQEVEDGEAVVEI
jgi:hypothetical protein